MTSSTCQTRQMTSSTRHTRTKDHQMTSFMHHTRTKDHQMTSFMYQRTTSTRHTRTKDHQMTSFMRHTRTKDHQMTSFMYQRTTSTRHTRTKDHQRGLSGKTLNPKMTSSRPRTKHTPNDVITHQKVIIFLQKIPAFSKEKPVKKPQIF